MIKNYIKTAFRNFLRQRLFTGLNILGLATGMACSILIFLWVQDEWSYDRFNTHADRIYRITTELGNIKAAVVPIPLGYAAKAEIPAIKNATRLSPAQSIVTIGKEKYDEKNIFYADSNFLKIFTYPLLKGDPATVLKQGDGVVITEATARRYFGSADKAMGKMLHIDNDYKGNDLMVTAVLKNIPSNSHLQFDILLPGQLYDKVTNPGEAWNNYDVYSYIQFVDNFAATPAALKAVAQQLTGIRHRMDKANIDGVFFLEPLKDVHLHSRLLLDVKGQGNAQYVTVFLLVAIFILLIAGINFMNLSTAISGQRAKEVGMRKAVGAGRMQLMAQFITESVLLSVISLMLGALAAWTLIPLFNDLALKNLSINLLNIRVIGMLLGIAVLVGLVSGSYPAFFLSSFNPVKVLKGARNLPGGKTFFRNTLVVIQFSISVILIVSTLVVYKQLQHIRNRNIGFNKENLMYFALPNIGDLTKNYQALRSTLDQETGLGDYTLISHLPTNLETGTQITWPGMDPQTQIVAPQIFADENFLKTFHIQLLAGRFFSTDFNGDKNNYVVNETTLKAMHLPLDKAVGAKMSIGSREGQIIGVVKDFNFKPVYQSIEPLVLRNYNGISNGGAGFVVVKTSPAAMKKVIGLVEGALQQVFANNPFSYGFVDQDLSRLYTTEQRMGKLFNVFSVISVIISCLGLLGLATFATQRRIKEIGIRKVLGASEAGIVRMLSKDFIKLVLFALFIAFPISWWVMSRWLENFVYRIQITWWMFALAGIAAISIAMLTILYQSVKAAMANPVKSLRSE